jgi:integrase
MSTTIDRKNLEQIVKPENGELILSSNLASLTKILFERLDINPTSRADYEKRTPIFINFIKDNGLSRNTYLEYKRQLDSRTDYSISTKAKYLTVAKVILKELNRQGYLPADITSTIKGFKQSKKHKRDGVNDEEMSRLIEAVKILPNNSNSTRLKAILSLLTLQGLRQVEITRLEVSDCDLVAGTALVLGKGRDDKEIVYLHPETVKSLETYMRSNKIKSGALFTSRSNNSKGRRITTRSVRGMVKELLIKLNIPKTTHGFRHYFTTTLIKVYKGDLLEVAGYTRHRGLEMLQVYNDNIKHQADLPRYYSAFKGIGFQD